MADTFTPRISLDMDGVITIASPNAMGKIAPIRAGTRAFLQTLKSRGYEVVVYTAYKPLGGAKEYLRQQGLMGLISQVTDVKLPSKVYVDDRAVRFGGSWADTLADIDAFKPLTESPTKHRLSCVMAPCPADISSPVKAIGRGIPDSDLTEDGREDDIHITLKFGIDGDLPDGVRKALAGKPPIKVKLLKLSLFESDKQDVLKFDVESADCEAMHDAICKEVPHVDTHPVYHPHCTVAYCKPGKGKQYVRETDIDGKEFTISSVIFADRNGNKETINLG